MRRALFSLLAPAVVVACLFSLAAADENTFRKEVHDRHSAHAPGNDKSMKERVAEGELLRVLSLVRLGVTFTTQLRIEMQALALLDSNPLVEGILTKRIEDFVQALLRTPTVSHEPVLSDDQEYRPYPVPMMPPPTAMLAKNPTQQVVVDDVGIPTEGIQLARAYLEKEHPLLLGKPDDLKVFLMDSLRRQKNDVAQYAKELDSLDHSVLYRDRGLATDSDVYGMFIVEFHLFELVRHSLIPKGGIEKVAILGPGLDFVNKRMGYDFYPPQCLQPFAVVDSLIRHGLAEKDRLSIVTFDISPSVNDHLRSIVTNPMPYTLQVVLSKQMKGGPTFKNILKGYWNRFGEHVGVSVSPVAVPKQAENQVEVRAVRIRPDVVRLITKVEECDVVHQEPGYGCLAPYTQQAFDMVIATNVLLYYNEEEHAKACQNIEAILKPGGVLISNTPVTAADDPLSVLSQLHMSKIPVREEQVDSVFAYMKKRATEPHLQRRERTQYTTKDDL